MPARDPIPLQRASEPVTRVTVSAPSSRAAAIDPRLFSNFLEHLGGTVYEGVWANVAYNPQFEADKQQRLSRWAMAGGATWGRNGVDGRAIDLPQGAAVTQLVSLPAHREREYVGSVWLKSADGRPAEIEVSIRAADKPAVLARASVRTSASTWSRQPLRLTLPEGALGRAESATLSIACTSGSASVDMIELFPRDHAEGVDPDVQRLSRDLRIELLRWPGGNFVSGYRWRDGVGPREKRPTKPNPAWGGLETHHFGTDEFMAFCKRIGAKPQICVNGGDGTPEEAAAWVEYCNGAASTPMGRLRAQNGHPAPYNVRVWEIGNELYGDWQIGHTDPKGNADRYVRFVKAMLAVDPTIEIIATGRGEEYTAEGLKKVKAWNDALLRAAKSAKVRLPDWLSLHPLVPLPGDLGRRPYNEVYESTMAHPTWWSDVHVPWLMRNAKAIVGSHRLQLAPTEWGIIIGGPNWPRFPNHDVQSGAVYAALYFNAMLRRADVVTLANTTALMHGGGIKRPNAVTYVDPMYHVQRMYGEARPARLVPVRVTGPMYDVPERGILPAVRNVSWVDVVAATDRRGERLLFVVNRDPRRARSVEISLDRAARSMEMETLAAAPQQGNSLARPDAVKPVKTTQSLSGRQLVKEFPPCSVTVIRLK
jgi:alpha-N-arabinofuranosidase